MFRSGYSVSLYCSVYFLCVNVYCTTATGVNPIAVNKYIISYLKENECVFVEELKEYVIREGLFLAYLKRKVSILKIRLMYFLRTDISVQA